MQAVAEDEREQREEEDQACVLVVEEREISGLRLTKQACLLTYSKAGDVNFISCYGVKDGEQPRHTRETRPTF